MSDSPTAPRRFKMDSELTADELAARSQFGASGRRFERKQYVAWRERTLRDEHDDLVLRARLLIEKAELLRAAAGDRQAAALEALSPEDWDRRLQARSKVGAGEPDPDASLPQDADVEATLERADALEREAAEIRAHLAEDEVVDPAEVIERIQGRQ